MSKTSSNRVIEKVLNRSGLGLTQPERQLAAMQEAFYAIEERRFSEWMAYLRNAAEHIRFYDSDLSFYNNDKQQPSQNWRQALPDEAQSLALEILLKGGVVSAEIKTFAARPDIAVLLTFFSLMDYPKQQFAQFTGRHKQHYYQNVLGFAAQSAQPDSANLVVTLSQDIKGMTLPSGTRFHGGSDVNGQPLIYKTLSNAVLNQAQVTRLDTLSGIHNNQRIFTRHLDMDNGLELSTEGALTFGVGVSDDLELTENQSHAQIGFTLASPALFLAGGERKVKLRFLRAENTESTVLELDSWFDIAVSTAEGMVLVDASIEKEQCPPCEGETESTGNYDLMLNFSSLFPPITALEGDLAPGVPALPHLRFLLKESGETDEETETKAAMSILGKRVFNRLRLDVEVKGLGGIVAENQRGALDTSGPIEPFTYQPAIGSRFTFTHPELLLKPISKACLTLDWLGRPKVLSDYYKAYSYYRYRNEDLENNTEDYDDWAVGLDGLEWPEPSVTLGRSDGIAPLASETLFSVKDPVNNIDQHDILFVNDDAADDPNGKIYEWQNLPSSQKSASLWPKFYSFTLSENDFGHGDFSQVAQFMGYYNAQQLQSNPDIVPIQVATKFVPIQVATPYTPLLNQVSLGYSSSTEISMVELSDFDKPLLQFIHPIGRPRIPAGTNVAILSPMSESAYLYIALKHVTTPGQVRLYFQIDPVDGSNISDDYFVSWRYLTADGFQSIPGSAIGVQAGNARIIEDSTQQLLNSGVLAIELPSIADELSALGDGLLWLQVSIYNGDQNRVNYSNIKGVYSQGVAVELVSDGVDASHFVQPLPALSISELDQADPRISEVIQPWPSFGASEQETDTQLSIRASERLRHKQRALTRWDYEHLVLNQFPEVYLARCYVPTDGDIDVELMLVPVNHDVSILQPKLPLYLHERVQTFIGSVCPPHLNVKVRDPLYEEVTFNAALKIYSGNDIDSVVSGLNQKLIDYLTPWQSSVGNDVRFRKSIHLTALAAMLEQDEAVDVVHFLEATVTVNGVTSAVNKTTNLIEPSSDASILVPSKKQRITLVDRDVAIASGIGKWRIEIDFAVS